MNNEKLEVDSVCWQGAPCLHTIITTNKDGKQLKQLCTSDVILWYFGVWKDKVVNKKDWLQHFAKKECKLNIVKMPLTKINVNQICNQSSPCHHYVELTYGDRLLKMQFGAREILKLVLKHRGITENFNWCEQHLNNDSIDYIKILDRKIQKEIRNAKLRQFCKYFSCCCISFQ